MEADHGEILREFIRLVQASERLNALAFVILDANRSVNTVAEIAPDLAPELGAVQERLTEVFDHLKSGVDVITAKVALLQARL